MNKDGSGCRSNADTEGRRNDFTKAVLVVGLTAAVVIALVGPASRDLRPSTLLEDAVAVNAAVRSTDQAPPTITSSAQRGRRTTPARSALALEDTPAVVDAPTSACVPCVAADRPPTRPRTAPGNPRADAAKPANPPATGKTDDGPASATTTATPHRSAVEPTPPRAEKRPSPKAAPPAPGRSDHAKASTPSADDRPGNEPSSPSDNHQKKAKH